MDEISIKRAQDPDAPGKEVLEVGGSATISQASALREALLESLRLSSEITVELSQVAELDLTALQLFCAAHQSAEKGGKRFKITDKNNEVFRKVVADAGFKRQLGCACDITSSCIWVEGER